MHRNYFDEVWELQYKWALGILDKEVRRMQTANAVLSEITGEYFNYAYPTVDKPQDLDLTEIEKIFKENNEKSIIYLLKKHQESGFMEHLDISI